MLSVIFLVVLIWLGWEFQPWMPAGRAVHLSSTHFGDYDFQVWQRKNEVVTEPFTTWLYARKQGGKWMSFLLDIQDTYRPSIILRNEDSGVAVLCGGEKLGFFDETQRTFTRGQGVTSFASSEIDSAPPDNWWLKPETEAGVPRKDK